VTNKTNRDDEDAEEDDEEADMADVTRIPLVPFARHLRADTNMYIRHLRNGRVANEGAGVAFWFRPRVAALSQVPLDDREQALLFHARTADFQDVTVQATVTFRLVDPTLAATRIDFGIDPSTGVWNGVPLETLGGLLTELAQQPALDLLAELPLQSALAGGLGLVRDRVSEALADDVRLEERGIAVTDVRVVAIRADADLEAALQTETRERVQQDADRATSERRAIAVERERAIAENELQNQIELARQEEELVGQRGQNARRRATEAAAADAIEADATAARRRLGAAAEADATRVMGEATAEAEAAKYAAHQGVDTPVMLALALQDLARNLPDVEHLTITPELLTPILARVAGLGGGTSTSAGDETANRAAASVDAGTTT